MTEPVTYRPIGIIRTPFPDAEGMPIQATAAVGVPGRIELDAEFLEGLADLDGFSHLILVYHLHRVSAARLTVTPFLDDRPHGIFATRSPARPNPIGLSTVRLVAIAFHLYICFDTTYCYLASAVRRVRPRPRPGRRPSGAALFAADASYEGRVLPGVRVGGTDLSGMDRGQAAAALKAAYAGYGAGHLIVRTTAGDVTVPYADIARVAHVDEMVDAAMATGRSGTTLERAVGEVRLATGGRTIEPWLTIDEAALKAKVEAGLAGLARPPVDSTIAMGPKTITLTPAQPGRAFDGTAAVAAAIAALGRTDAPDQLVVEADTVTTQPAVGLQDTLAAKYAAERMARGVIVTRGKDKWIIKAGVVRSWIHFETQADGSPWPVVDATAISKALTAVAKDVKVPAGLRLLSQGPQRQGRRASLPAKPGHKLDPAAMTAAIAKVVEARAGYVQGANVKVRLAPVAPKLTTEQASKAAPVMQILGTWKTWFPVNDHNFFGANIWHPGQDHRRHRARARPDVRVVERGRPGQPVTRVRAGRVHRRRPHGADRRPRRRHVLELDDAVQRGPARRACRWARARITSTTSTAIRSASTRRCRRRGGGSQTMSFTNDMTHPIVIRTFRYTRGRPGLGPLRDLGHPGRPDGEPQQAVRLQRPQATTSTVFVSSLKPGVRMQTEFPAERDGRGGLARRAQGRPGHPSRDVPHPLRPLERRHPGGSLGGLRRLDRMSRCTASARPRRSNPTSGSPRSTTSAGPSSRSSTPGSGRPFPTPDRTSTTGS